MPQDELTWVRLLTMINELLKHTKKNLKHPGLMSLRTDYLLPAYQHKEPGIRELAVKGLAVYSMLDRHAAADNLLLLLQPLIHGDATGIQIVALQAVFDVILLFGLDIVARAASASVASSSSEAAAAPALTMSPSDVVKTLTAFLSDDDEDMRTNAAEGFTKLLLLGRLADGNILSHLVLLYFNPATEDDAHLRQCLSAFFPAFLAASDAHRTMLRGAVLPSVRVVIEAPKSSPLADINASQMASVLLALLHDAPAAATTQTDVVSAHEELMFELAADICANPASLGARTFCQLMSQLVFNAEHQHNIKSFRHLVEQATMAMAGTKDKIALKYLAKVEQSLLAMDVTPDANMDDDALSQLRLRTESLLAHASGMSATTLGAAKAQGTMPRTARKGGRSTVKKQKKKKLGVRGQKDWELSEEESDVSDGDDDEVDPVQTLALGDDDSSVENGDASNEPLVTAAMAAAVPVKKPGKVRIRGG